MTLKLVKRPTPPMRDPFCATPRDAVHMTGYRLNGRWQAKIWIGKDLADQCGLTEHRYAVDLLIDEEARPLKVAVDINESGQYRCTRKGLSYCVHIDSVTTDTFFKPSYREEVDRSTISTRAGRIAFTVPARWNPA